MIIAPTTISATNMTATSVTKTPITITTVMAAVPTTVLIATIAIAVTTEFIGWLWKWPYIKLIQKFLAHIPPTKTLPLPPSD